MNTRRDEQGRVEVNPDILMGKPVIAGTRIPVYLILNLLASGSTQERIVEAYAELAQHFVESNGQPLGRPLPRDQETSPARSLQCGGEKSGLEEPPPPQAQEASPVQPRGLTQEDKEVLVLVARGLSDDEIAEKLRVSAIRICQVKDELFRRFGVNRDDDLVWEAQKGGYLQ